MDTKHSENHFKDMHKKAKRALAVKKSAPVDVIISPAKRLQEMVIVNLSIASWKSSQDILIHLNDKRPGYIKKTEPPLTLEEIDAVLADLQSKGKAFSCEEDGKLKWKRK